MSIASLIRRRSFVVALPAVSVLVLTGCGASSFAEQSVAESTARVWVQGDARWKSEEPLTACATNTPDVLSEGDVFSVTSERGIRVAAVEPATNHGASYFILANLATPNATVDRSATLVVASCADTQAPAVVEFLNGDAGTVRVIAAPPAGGGVDQGLGVASGDPTL